ncbi:MAG: DNA adenine methylase [Candidatus Scalindua sp.]|nr:DNA adenine methylase [Candidatus Scalindua sp.]MDR4503385.1 DNA adenine methylase [Candidatus Scalindua sp.]MDR4503574.1 DNA adenine methylase [Candidatus Scalindua sp.]MDR4503720.1 DNA adenine methylase [Candidatus Scalindua sp.]MDR4503831.1 DNA adenine methylase [Candidatus Scalindua sp.]
MNYPGGKGGVFQKLINLMPPHDVYIETHLGGGAVIRNKRPARSNFGIEIDSEVVEMWTNMHPIGFELVHDDAINYLNNYHFTGKELVYCDPPYLRETRKKYGRLYKYDYSRAQHIELLEVLKTLPCMVMISGYESTLYKESLRSWQTHSFQAVCHHGVATEWLWMNYSVPVGLHDYRYLGNNFRERERIKRKTKRWTAKLKSMPVLERQALLFAIDVFRER